MADGKRSWPGFGEMLALPHVAGSLSQVVEVADRDRCQAFKRGIPKHLKRVLEELLGGRTAQGAVQFIGFGQRPNIRRRVVARETVAPPRLPPPYLPGPPECPD